MEGEMGVKLYWLHRLIQNYFINRIKLEQNEYRAKDLVGLLKDALPRSRKEVHDSPSRAFHE